jgi:uncharacterized coiled-coil DUF342 family protein
MKISALLREAPSTPALSLDQDLMQRAMLKFPGYDSQQALSLYMADKLNQQQKIDASQNNLINTQRSAIQTLQGELDANEDEVERIKQLTARVTAGSADTREKAKVSGDELEKLQKQLEELKNKPNLDPKQYKEMEAQIMALASSPSAENSDVRKLQSLVNSIDSKAKVNYDAVYKQLQTTKDDLDSKEDRFKKYVKDTNVFKDETKAYKTQITQQVADASTQLQQFAKDATELRKLQQDATTDATEIRNLLNAVTQLYKSLAVSDKTPQSGTYQDIQPVGSNFNALAEDATLLIQKILNEEGRLNWSNPIFNKWMERNIPFYYNQFIGMFRSELEKVNPPYGKKQILDTLQDEAVIIKIHMDNNNGITPDSRTNEHYLTVVKNALFQQKPQPDLNLSNESIDMLDRIIKLSSIKRVKKQ